MSKVEKSKEVYKNIEEISKKFPNDFIVRAVKIAEQMYDWEFDIDDASMKKINEKIDFLSCETKLSKSTENDITNACEAIYNYLFVCKTNITKNVIEAEKVKEEKVKAEQKSKRLSTSFLSSLDGETFTAIVSFLIVTTLFIFACCININEIKEGDLFTDKNNLDGLSMFIGGIITIPATLIWLAVIIVKKVKNKDVINEAKEILDKEGKSRFANIFKSIKISTKGANSPVVFGNYTVTDSHTDSNNEDTE